MSTTDSSVEVAASRTTVIATWVLLLFGLTAIGIAPLYVLGLNAKHLSPQTVSPAVGVGIELTAYAPSLAAILVAAFIIRRGGLRWLLGQLGRWRTNVGWYAIALLGPVGLFLLAAVLRVALGSSVPARWIALPSGFALSFAIGSIVAGSLGEEIGWRGFGQALLQRRAGPLVASLVIGVVWTVWHYWGIFAPGGLSDFAFSGFALSVVRMCALSVLYAWLYNVSRQSLPVAMSAHAGHNLANNLVQSNSGGVALGDVVIIFYAVAAVLVVVLTRRRLGLELIGAQANQVGA